MCVVCHYVRISMYNEFNVASSSVLFGTVGVVDAATVGGQIDLFRSIREVTAVGVLRMVHNLGRTLHRVVQCPVVTQRRHSSIVVHWVSAGLHPFGGFGEVASVVVIVVVIAIVRATVWSLEGRMHQREFWLFGRRLGIVWFFARSIVVVGRCRILGI